MKTKPKKQKLGPNQRRWIKALRSGRYKQGDTRLRDVQDRHCCLGVGCRVMRVPGLVEGTRWRYDGATVHAPKPVREALALCDAMGKFKTPMNGRVSLADANDHGATFTEIADFCEAHPEAVFTEAR